jgi:2-amino-4-hydroxy-6-hydroxymethyldihydropteridine diphosphokinase
MTHLAMIGLGANLGDPEQAVRSAIAECSRLPSTRLKLCSSLYRSAPVDADGDSFINCVLAVQTTLSPIDLLQALQQLEQNFGRVRSYRNAPRTLDCDLLLYNQYTINLPELTVPHPRMLQRAFVLVPLLEIAPDIVIPGHGMAADWLAQVADQSISKIT